MSNSIIKITVIACVFACEIECIFVRAACECMFVISASKPDKEFGMGVARSKKIKSVVFIGRD